MEVRALISSTDNITASLIRRSLLSVGVSNDEGVKVEDVLARVRRQRYEGLVLDLSVPGAKDLLSKLRSEPATKSAVLFVLADGKSAMREAFQLGATFVLEKPLSLDRTMRCFRAAYGIIIGERRRYFRHKVNAAVAIARSGADPLVAYSIDISSGGMLLDCPTPFAEAAQLKLQFGLPGVEDKVVVAAHVIWAKNGKVGLHFSRFGKQSKDVLTQWLSQQMDKEMGMGSLPSAGEMKIPASLQ